MMDEVREKVERVLRKKGLLTPGRELLWGKYGEGYRISLVAPVKGGRMVEMRSASVGRLTGTVRDQANGILGAFFSKG